MTKIVLLAVIAAWAAVLLPPLLRSRGANRPGSSVSDFSRQLSTLQRSVPTRGMAPMRSMARPLAQSPTARPVAAQRNAPASRSNVDTTLRARQEMHAASMNRTGQRRSHGDPQAVHGESRRVEEVARHAPVRRTLNAREEVRRRRSNMVFTLLMCTVATLFLAATTHATAMMYAFAISFLALCGYCYKLSQLRQVEHDRQMGENSWFRAA